MGRARALEVMLCAQDRDAELAERYGWINRTLPVEELDGFVRSLAHQIARFPATGHATVKRSSMSLDEVARPSNASELRSPMRIR